MAAAQAKAELETAKRIATLETRDGFSFALRKGATYVWLVARIGKTEVLALRSGLGAAIETVANNATTEQAHVCEWTTALGATRVKIEFPTRKSATLRCTTSFLPARETRLAKASRDLYMLNDAKGTVHGL